ncbi:MAG: hypothetical protein ACYC35_28370 [Pirellulales bacterium]
MASTDESWSELLESAHALSRADKLRLIQQMVVDLARDEGVSLEELGGAYPVWTPLDAFDAAAVLLRELRQGESS